MEEEKSYNFSKNRIKTNRATEQANKISVNNKLIVRQWNKTGSEK